MRKWKWSITISFRWMLFLCLSSLAKWFWCVCVCLRFTQIKCKLMWFRFKFRWILGGARRIMAWTHQRYGCKSHKWQIDQPNERVWFILIWLVIEVIPIIVTNSLINPNNKWTATTTTKKRNPRIYRVWASSRILTFRPSLHSRRSPSMHCTYVSVTLIVQKNTTSMRQKQNIDSFAMGRHSHPLLSNDLHAQ